MDAKGARSKGRKWDNTVAKILSEWYFGVPDALQRTHGSRSIQGFEDQVGDLGVAKTGLDRPWIFGVENKHRDASGRKAGAWSLEDLVTLGHKSTIMEYWIQCVDAADKGNKIPLLVAKKNYFAPIVGIRSTDWVDCFSDSPDQNNILFNQWIVFMTLPNFLKSDPLQWMRYWKQVYGN